MTHSTPLGVGQASGELDGVPCVSPSQTTSATSRVSVCFTHPMRPVSNSQIFSHSKPAPLCCIPWAYGGIPAHPGRGLWSENCRDEGLSLFHICIPISTL